MELKNVVSMALQNVLLRTAARVTVALPTVVAVVRVRDALMSK